MSEPATKAMPLARPVGSMANWFYDRLIQRGMVPGMSVDEAFALATDAEWERYHYYIQTGSAVRAGRYADGEPVSTRTRPYDDELAQDEREHGDGR